jgi:hypothetical protein
VRSTLDQCKLFDYLILPLVTLICGHLSGYQALWDFILVACIGTCRNKPSSELIRCKDSSFGINLGIQKIIFYCVYLGI